ncbi:MAG: 16S rRNA (cytosine(1402)-N(4))-methyltransferase RsmH [Victivallaceae bacterium]|nr:16S rRNA (cytosine(1402)-N(4))-methyltransferase RsmH [Victivallaceae bacterium]MDD3117077.1 16S rRNA (cytosine(1402)-N(4))-methyltransferase RsmH [Victivallaceae bacterium]MDD3703375.1 16S rRNA (cytosine(1402)-N(4))-methyltransferase RsmH [Victivallaceae bacterium]MDD4318019.1 16S rRNA (cytosine(1402)-N(4))-methyltransferase RsmH [Victivallaceae bacterium]MDD5663380.1 16S rRNA (cytosine(1402)-N(4))-methyltransferase RsmH [Victivallaceae bacterium]
MNCDSDDYIHYPVLHWEVVEYLTWRKGCVKIVDGTLGCGGHSSLILKENRQAELLGIDRDGDALRRATEVLRFAEERIHLFRGNFSDLKEYAAELEWNSVDAVLLDLGVSSPQIDDAGRGFSLRFNGPLDMRMDQRNPVTAARILNLESEEELGQIFRDYGEVRQWRRLAREVVRRRQLKAFDTTSDFAEFCEKILGKARPGRLPTPTLVFQALRIAVNNELSELEDGLEAALEILAPGGRLAVISFHSLEDRIVKNFFRDLERDCICPPKCPVCICGGGRAKLKILTKKPVTASSDERAENSRSGCAKLRVAERI